MANCSGSPRRGPLSVLSGAGSTGAEDQHPAFVIVERTATTGPETIQQATPSGRATFSEYAARYLARSQENTLLEGEGWCSLLHGHPAVSGHGGRDNAGMIGGKPGSVQGAPKRANSGSSRSRACRPRIESRSTCQASRRIRGGKAARNCPSGPHIFVYDFPP